MVPTGAGETVRTKTGRGKGRTDRTICQLSQHPADLGLDFLTPESVNLCKMSLTGETKFGMLDTQTMLCLRGEHNCISKRLS